MYVKGKRLIVATGSVVAAIAISAGVSWAVWSASGSGAGGAGAKIAQPLVVTEVDPSGPGDSLYPGGPPGWVYFTVQNPNPYAVTITGLSWGTPTSNNPTTCPSSNISLDPGAPTTVSISVGANSTSGAFQVLGVLDLAHSAPDGCQGVTFRVPLSVTGVQQ